MARASVPPTHVRRSRRRWTIALVPVVGVAVALGVIVATSGGPAPTAPVKSYAITATVQRRNLVISQNETGTIRYTGSSTVTDQLEGTLTWAPGIGQVIRPGQRLFAVNAFPVILLDGTTPAYRTLQAADVSGPDVAQLNANLISLGFDPDPIVNDDSWQAATTAGVKAFQTANDEPATGALALGTVEFLQGAQRVATRQGAAMTVSDEHPTATTDFVSDVIETTSTADGAATTTATGQSSPTTTSVAPAPATSDSPATATATATTPTATTPTSTTTTTSTTAATTPETAALARALAAISAVKRQNAQLQRREQRLARELAAATASAGSGRASHPKTTSAGSAQAAANAAPPTGGDSAVLTTTSTRLVVGVAMPAGQQGVTRVGAQVPVIMPSGRTVHGTVTAIGGSGSGGAGKVPITIHLNRAVSGRDLDQATVSVSFVQSAAHHVLSVPVTALVARPGGRYAVEEASAPHRLIPVHLGIFATGYVQVSGSGLQPGLSVTDSQG